MSSSISAPMTSKNFIVVFAYIARQILVRVYGGEQLFACLCISGDYKRFDRQAS